MVNKVKRMIYQKEIQMFLVKLVKLRWKNGKLSKDFSKFSKPT